MQVFDTRKGPNPITVFQNLISESYGQRSLQDCRRRPLTCSYDELPDTLKVGGMIRSLPEKERAALANLTSDMAGLNPRHVGFIWSSQSYVKPEE